MKRLLALLLCLSLLLPVFSFAEDEEEDYDMDDLIDDIEMTNESDEAVIGSEEDLSAFPDDADFVIDDNYDKEINTNLPDHVINILLIGVDTRGDEDDDTDSPFLHDQMEKGKHKGYPKRNDVNMILSINTETGSVKLTSFSRELMVDIPDKGVAPIYYAFSYRYMKKTGEFNYAIDVPERVIRTVNRNFQLNIQHFVAINFYGVEEIIEYFGGVDIDLTKAEAKAINSYIKKNKSAMKRNYDMHSEGRVALKETNGVQHLDGLQGLVYARLRKVGTSRTDMVRTGRTRNLVQSLFHPLMEKLKGNEVDPLNLVVELSQYFVTDMTLKEMAELVTKVWPIVRDSDIMSDLSAVTSLIEEHAIPGEKDYVYQGVHVKLKNMQRSVEELHDFIYDGMYYGTSN